MKHFKNQAVKSPCTHCPKQLGCPFLIFDFAEKYLYCLDFEQRYKQIEDEYKATGWEPLETIPAPYMPN